MSHQDSVKNWNIEVQIMPMSRLVGSNRLYESFRKRTGSVVNLSSSLLERRAAGKKCSKPLNTSWINKRRVIFLLFNNFHRLVSR